METVFASILAVLGQPYNFVGGKFHMMTKHLSFIVLNFLRLYLVSSFVFFPVESEYLRHEQP